MDMHSVVESYGLPGYVSVFQVEVMALLETCRWPVNTVTVTDNQAVIVALHSVATYARQGSVLTQ